MTFRTTQPIRPPPTSSWEKSSPTPKSTFTGGCWLLAIAGSDCTEAGIEGAGDAEVLGGGREAREASGDLTGDA